VLLALAGTSGVNLGFAIQKEALGRLPPLRSMPLPRQLSLMFGSGRWLMGLATGLAGGCSNFAAIALVGMAVVQPLMGFGLAALLWYGRRRLGERLSPRAMVGVACLVVLPALIAFARVGPAVDSVLQPAVRLRFLLAVAGVLGSCLLLWLFSARLPLLLAAVSGILYTVTPLTMQSVLQLLAATGLPLVPAVLFLLARFFTRPAGAVTLGIALFGSTVSSVRYYIHQVGLQRNPATRFNPIMQAVNVVTGVALGIAVYGQSLGRPLLYLVALGCAMAGILLLSPLVKEQPAPAPGR
jgi:drug/metabolite transporter (DMT)-like permease